MATSVPPHQDRVAIVTVSSRGIGKDMALHLAPLGARLVINYTSSSNHADSVAAEINANQATPRAITVRVDVSDSASVKSLFDSAEEAFNSLVHIIGITANCVAPRPTATELFFDGKTEETVKIIAEGSPFGRIVWICLVNPRVSEIKCKIKDGSERITKLKELQAKQRNVCVCV